MNSYFEVGVRYDKTMEDGVIRKVTENYLFLSQKRKSVPQRKWKPTSVASSEW